MTGFHQLRQEVAEDVDTLSSQQYRPPRTSERAITSYATPIGQLTPLWLQLVALVIVLRTGLTILLA
jgi:hypothetical protein